MCLKVSQQLFPSLDNNEHTCSGVAVKAVLSVSCTLRADVSHAQQPDKNPACCFMISDHCGNHSVALFAAVTSPLRSPPAFAGFPHYTTHLAIFPELKLLPFLACFHDYSLIIYDVIKSSAHLAWCMLSGVMQHSALLFGAFWFPSKAMGAQTFSWAGEPKGFLTET